MGVEFSNQLDFGGPLQGKLEEEYSRGRKDVAGPPPAMESTPNPTIPVAQETSPAKITGNEAAVPSLGLEKWPPCTEPWRNFYILRRGVLPCSYGHSSIAGMDGYREAWNSPLMQEIRGHLARGSFHRYCLRSSTCPIVRKSSHLHRFPLAQRMLMWSWRSWKALNSLTAGAPRRLLRRMGIGAAGHRFLAK